MVGNPGAREFLSDTAVGDTENLAERLEELARGGEILIAESTRQALGGAVQVEPRGLTSIRGRSEPVAVYELLGLVPKGTSREEKT